VFKGFNTLRLDFRNYIKNSKRFAFEIVNYVFDFSWLSRAVVYNVSAVVVFYLYFKKTKLQLWFVTYAHAIGCSQIIVSYIVALWEPLELLKDLVYIFAFPHVSWITIAVLWSCVLSSFFTSILWFY